MKESRFESVVEETANGLGTNVDSTELLTELNWRGMANKAGVGFANRLAALQVNPNKRSPGETEEHFLRRQIYTDGFRKGLVGNEYKKYQKGYSGLLFKYDILYKDITPKAASQVGVLGPQTATPINGFYVNDPNKTLTEAKLNTTYPSVGGWKMVRKGSYADYTVNNGMGNIVHKLFDGVPPTSEVVEMRAPVASGSGGPDYESLIYEDEINTYITSCARLLGNQLDGKSAFDMGAADANLQAGINVIITKCKDKEFEYIMEPATSPTGAGSVTGSLTVSENGKNAAKSGMELEVFYNACLAIDAFKNSIFGSSGGKDYAKRMIMRMLLNDALVSEFNVIAESGISALVGSDIENRMNVYHELFGLPEYPYAPSNKQLLATRFFAQFPSYMKDIGGISIDEDLYWLPPQTAKQATDRANESLLKSAGKRFLYNPLVIFTKPYEVFNNVTGKLRSFKQGFTNVVNTIMGGTAATKVPIAK